jgi:hypothetical protein
MSNEFQGIEHIDPKTVYLIQVGDFDIEFLDMLERIKDIYLNNILRNHKIPIKVEVLWNNIPFQEMWYEPHGDYYLDVNLSLGAYQSYYGSSSKGKCAIISIKKFRQYVSKAIFSVDVDEILAKTILKFIGHIFGLSNCRLDSCLMTVIYDIKTIDLLSFSYCDACSNYLIKGERLSKVQKIPILTGIAIRGDDVPVERIIEYFAQGDPETIIFCLENAVYESLNSSNLEKLILTLLKTKAIIPFINCFETIVSRSLQEEYNNEEEEYDDDELEFEELFWDFLNTQLKDIKALENKIKSVIMKVDYNETELYRIKYFLRDYTPIPYGFFEEWGIKNAY